MIKNSDKDIQQSIVIDVILPPNQHPVLRISRRCLIRWFSIGCTAIQSMLNPKHIQVSPQQLRLAASGLCQDLPSHQQVDSQ